MISVVGLKFTATSARPSARHEQSPAPRVLLRVLPEDQLIKTFDRYSLRPGLTPEKGSTPPYYSAVLDGIGLEDRGWAAVFEGRAEQRSGLRILDPQRKPP